MAQLPNTSRNLVPYHLNTFVGGQSDWQDKGIKGSFKFGYGLNIRDQEDSITCNQALKDDLAPGTFHAPCYFVVPASDGNTYFFLYDGSIYSRHSDGTYHYVHGDSAESGHIIGAAEWYDSSGWTYLMWATPTRLNIKKIIGPSYTNAEPWTDANTASIGIWPKTNLTSTSWHTMANTNGVLEICNGNLMALVGYDLSYTNNALALIPGNSAKCVLERSKYGIIGCTRSDGKDETDLFSWDGIGLHWNDKGITKFGGLNCMIDTEIALAQIGTEGQLYITDFKTPVPFRQIKGGGHSNPDAVASYHGMALMGIFGNTYLTNGVYANGVYAIGRLNKNAPLVIDLEYQLTCDEIYSVKTVGTDILIVYKNGTNYGVKIVDTNTKADCVYQSLDLDAPIGTTSSANVLGRMLNWQRIDVEARPLPAGCGVEVWYKYDKRETGGRDNDGWIQANLLGSDVTRWETEGGQNAMFAVGQKARTLEVMIKLFANGNNAPDLHEVNPFFTT
jgi:hypothetical protein